MASAENSFRISAAAHGGSSFTDPVGATITETINWVYNYPAARLAPAICINEYRCSARVEYQGRSTPIVRGTSATLTLTVLDIDNGTATISVTTMKAGAYGFDGNQQLHRHSQEFEYDSAASDNLAPITVGA